MVVKKTRQKLSEPVVIRVAGVLALSILAASTMYFISINNRTYATTEEARNVCGETFYAIINDSPFYDVVEVQSDSIPSYIEQQDMFACSQADAEAIVDFITQLNYATLALFAIIWVPPLLIFIVLYWLWIEWKNWQVRKNAA